MRNGYGLGILFNSLSDSAGQLSLRPTNFLSINPGFRKPYANTVNEQDIRKLRGCDYNHIKKKTKLCLNQDQNQGTGTQKVNLTHYDGALFGSFRFLNGAIYNTSVSKNTQNSTLKVVYHKNAKGHTRK